MWRHRSNLIGCKSEHSSKWLENPEWWTANLGGSNFLVDIIQGMAALNSLILSILFCFNIEVSTILFSILTYTLHQKKITKNVPDLNTYIHSIVLSRNIPICSALSIPSLQFYSSKQTSAISAVVHCAVNSWDVASGQYDSYEAAILLSTSLTTPQTLYPVLYQYWNEF